MCGRFTRMYTWKELHRLMRLATGTPELPFAPSYNVAPTQTSPVVLQTEQGREARPMRWGLVPPWATDLTFGNRCINARSEEAASKPAFRAAMKSRRCLVPISGFYEWQKVGDKLKQPWYFTPADGTLFALAGLWESWGASDTRTETFTLLTGPPNELLARIHDRMPCIMPPTSGTAGSTTPSPRPRSPSSTPRRCWAQPSPPASTPPATTPPTSSSPWPPKGSGDRHLHPFT